MKTSTTQILGIDDLTSVTGGLAFPKLPSLPTPLPLPGGPQPAPQPLPLPGGPQPQPDPFPFPPGTPRLDLPTFPGKSGR
jgi:hypothetical protein